jgi:putative membrane protein
MRKLFYVLAICGLALVFQSCGNSSRNATDTSDTSMIANDSTFTVDSGTSTLADSDTSFANKAAVGGMAEVTFGKLAGEKASSAAVKDFATMMVKDHGKANEELKAIAAAKNITLPAGLDAEHAKKQQELEAKSGAEFDKAYVMAMVEGHEKTLALMEDGSKNCKDADLKGFAAKTAPVVKHHLDMIRKIQTDLK